MGAKKAAAKYEKGDSPDGDRAELPYLSEVEDHARDEETEQLHPHREGEGYKHYVNEALWPEGCFHNMDLSCADGSHGTAESPSTIVPILRNS